MKLLSVNLIDGTKLEVLLEDTASASEIFSVFNSGGMFNAKTMDGEEAEVFVHGSKFSAFVLSNYTVPPTQEEMLIAMNEFEKTQQTEDEEVFPIFFEGDDGGIYGNDGSTFKPPSSNIGSHEDDAITIVHR